MKRTPLNRKAPRRTKAPARWTEAKAPWCQGCANPKGLTLHHIVYEQHVRKHGGDRWDPRNAMTLCRQCHEGHHNASRRVLLHLLPNQALEFAFELLGSAAFDYFRRYYEGDDERLFDSEGEPRLTRWSGPDRLGESAA